MAAGPSIDVSGLAGGAAGPGEPGPSCAEMLRARLGGPRSPIRRGRLRGQLPRQ
jgi:hypothetical protein